MIAEVEEPVGILFPGCSSAVHMITAKVRNLKVVLLAALLSAHIGSVLHVIV